MTATPLELGDGRHEEQLRGAKIFVYEEWRKDALCRDGAAALVNLFFSTQINDIVRAKDFCSGCEVKTECLEGALERREPWGVWGGEYLQNGKIITQKRATRGRSALQQL